MTVDPRFQQLIQHLDVILQSYPLADLAQMFLSHLGAKFWIVQQKIGELRSLLHQINLGHSLGLALELLRRNADQFRQHVAGIVEGQCLVKIARENVAPQNMLSIHGYSIHVSSAMSHKKN